MLCKKFRHCDPLNNAAYPGTYFGSIDSLSSFACDTNSYTQCLHVCCPNENFPAGSECCDRQNNLSKIVNPWFSRHVQIQSNLGSRTPRIMNISVYEQIFRTQSVSDDVLCLELRTREPSTSWSDKLRVSASAVFVEET